MMSSTRKEDIQAQYDAIAVEREDYILSLGQGQSDLEKWNSGKQIYDTLTYPQDKSLQFHLYDTHHILQKSPERSIDPLNDNAVVQLVQYFVDHTEDRMYELRKTQQWDGLSGGDDHESQIYRELATSYKKQYFEKLLALLQTRKTQYYQASWDNQKIVLDEDIYIALVRLADTSDKEKNAVLDTLLLNLPNQERDDMPDMKKLLCNMQVTQ